MSAPPLDSLLDLMKVPLWESWMGCQLEQPLDRLTVIELVALLEMTALCLVHQAYEENPLVLKLDWMMEPMSG